MKQIIFTIIVIVLFIPYILGVNEQLISYLNDLLSLLNLDMINYLGIALDELLNYVYVASLLGVGLFLFGFAKFIDWLKER